MEILHDSSLSYKTFVTDSSKDWVVFLHGLGGDWNIFHKQIDYFKDHFNLLFIDLPGHGKSPLIKRRKNLLSYTAKKVLTLMDNLSISSAHFLGVSLGTIIMQSIAMTHPHRIKSMTLAGAAGKWLKWGELLGRVTISFPFSHLLPYMVPFKVFAHIVLPKPNHSKSRNIFIREAKKLGRYAYLSWANVIRNSYKTYERLKDKTNNIPKLYVSGDEDHMFIQGITNHVKRESLAKLHIIKKCGHVCNLEKAAEFNQVAFHFISGISAESAYAEIS
ncbi:beta-ketoadipate enol-lactone hydrolase [Pontibacillus chungwhensis BH030062]|uniref:Beta-ketoadipate enol-lactone hydrolase n=1 Tax=Pontibacillus chungwhensis BH030062 TaxID=1385513 RepID=A0A0A2VCS2_9BACI|nr:alpha/beta hydrolase [Pontibacillus chungwhensis]KGP91445.1 beta-ketoadipate enol-lactone hydrolase [Pontibacillus chungwhensis BH030062]